MNQDDCINVTKNSVEKSTLQQTTIKYSIWKVNVFLHEVKGTHWVNNFLSPIKKLKIIHTTLIIICDKNPYCNISNTG